MASSRPLPVEQPLDRLVRDGRCAWARRLRAPTHLVPDQREDTSGLQEVVYHLRHRPAVGPVERLRERHEREPPETERAEVFRPSEHPPHVRDPSTLGVARRLRQHLAVRIEAHDLCGVWREVDGDRPRPAPHVERAPASEAGFAGEELGERAGVRRAAAQVVGGGASEERGVIGSVHASIFGVDVEGHKVSYAIPKLTACA